MHVLISKDRRLGEQCEDHIQCKAATRHSMCNKDNECSCQERYVELNDSCVSGKWNKTNLITPTSVIVI